MTRRSVWLLSAAAVLAVSASVLQASTPRFWLTSTQADLLKGQVERLSIDDQGRLVPGPNATTVFDATGPFLWTMAAAPDGTLFAGGGNEGKVWRIDRQGKSTLFFDAAELEVHALAIAAGRERLRRHLAGRQGVQGRRPGQVVGVLRSGRQVHLGAGVRSDGPPDCRDRRQGRGLPRDRGRHVPGALQGPGDARDVVARRCARARCWSGRKRQAACFASARPARPSSCSTRRTTRFAACASTPRAPSTRWPSTGSPRRPSSPPPRRRPSRRRLSPTPSVSAEITNVTVIDAPTVTGAPAPAGPADGAFNREGGRLPHRCERRRRHPLGAAGRSAVRSRPRRRRQPPRRDRERGQALPAVGRTGARVARDAPRRAADHGDRGDRHDALLRDVEPGEDRPARRRDSRPTASTSRRRRTPGPSPRGAPSPGGRSPPRPIRFRVFTRAGNTPTPDDTWSDWAGTVPAPGRRSPSRARRPATSSGRPSSRHRRPAARRRRSCR